LAKAEHELPSYGRAAIASANGIFMSGGFAGFLIFVLAENKGIWLRFWTIVTAGEVAAWRLKWVALPVAIAVLWTGSRINRSIKNSPVRFAGLRAARVGLMAAALATLTIATLIGITIPERLRQRQMSIDAGNYARGYTISRAMLEYRQMRGTYPQNDILKELREVPDPDGSIAEALRGIDPNGYSPSAVLASTSTNAKQALRGGVLRNAALKTNGDSPTDHGVPFTSYELRLAGEDRILNTDDDLIMRNGLIIKASDPRPSSSAPTRPSNP
jgi:hypothetical protein